MGREKTILLGFLGLLAGVFVGVLSIKLLLPRPPTGTGPDIRPEVAVTTAQERVEPPAPSAVGWDFAAAPPLVPEPAPATPLEASTPAPAADDPPGASRFAAAAPLVPEAPAEPPLDGDVTTASWQETEAAPVAAADAIEPDGRFEPAATGRAAWPTDPVASPPAPFPTEPPAVFARTATPVAGDYLVQAGDSWWDLAERAYGDGRLYRALFAWNRTRDPRLALAPGTRLDVPPLARLQAAWPRLVPTGTP